LNFLKFVSLEPTDRIWQNFGQDRLNRILVEVELVEFDQYLA